MPATIQLPVLPLRDIVVFPLATMPLLAGRAKSLKACEAAASDDGRILLIAQRDAAIEEPSLGDLYGIGVIATLTQHLTMLDGRMKLLVRGEQRARVVRLIDDPSCLIALAEPIADAGGTAPDVPDFSLADWAADGSANASNRVADLQRILEDESLDPADRLHAMRRLIGSG